MLCFQIFSYSISAIENIILQLDELSLADPSWEFAVEGGQIGGFENILMYACSLFDFFVFGGCG